MPDAITLWLAKEKDLDAALISDLGFAASPGHAWSEITIEEFSCFVKFNYDGAPMTHYLGEDEVCRMLNEAFPA